MPGLRLHSAAAKVVADVGSAVDRRLVRAVDEFVHNVYAIHATTGAQSPLANAGHGCQLGIQTNRHTCRQLHESALGKQLPAHVYLTLASATKTPAFCTIVTKSALDKPSSVQT